MRVAIVLLLLVLVGASAFVTLNWGAVITPVDLSLGVGMVKMPLGLVMLGLLLAITALFLVFVLFLQTSVLLETRRQAKEIRASRDLADQAEASRFTELRRFIESALAGKATAGAGGAPADVLERIDRLERELRALIEQSGNGVAAHLGELEDRLERASVLPVQRR